jgi:hypothetical protein
MVERWHCENCQPHRARLIMCSLCSATVLLGDELAPDDTAQLAEPASLWSYSM